MPVMGKTPWDSSGSDIILAEGAQQALEMSALPDPCWNAASVYPLPLGLIVVKILGFTGKEDLGRERKRELLGSLKLPKVPIY